VNILRLTQALHVIAMKATDSAMSSWGRNDRRILSFFTT